MQWIRSDINRYIILNICLSLYRLNEALTIGLTCYSTTFVPQSRRVYFLERVRFTLAYSPPCHQSANSANLLCWGVAVGRLPYRQRTSRERGKHKQEHVVWKYQMTVFTAEFQRPRRIKNVLL